MMGLVSLQKGEETPELFLSSTGPSEKVAI